MFLIFNITMPLISVIIPTKNEAKNIARCLNSIKSQNTSNKLQINSNFQNSKYQTSKQFAIEVIVVDNHSTDKTTRIAKKLGAKVYSKGPERSSQRNFGAKKAKAKYIFFVDADMEIGNQVINQAIKLFKSHPKLVAITVPEIAIGTNFWGKVRALEKNCYTLEPTVEAPRVFIKSKFLKTGGFDEKLVAGEDWDLKFRISKLGSIQKTKDVITHHEDKLSLIKHLKKKYYYSKNILNYAKKHPEKFKQQSGLVRLKIFLKHWKSFVSDPIHGLGVIILKTLEYLLFLTAKVF